jgi:anthranilate/para-aminobenzoate synthase component II
MKAAFIDFEDSFSYNVVQELCQLGLEVQVMHWMDFESLPEADLLVAGPGPGHPDDYQRIFPLLQNWLDQERPFLGICLGHQLFWRLQHEPVVRSAHPLHGQQVELHLNADWSEWLNLPSSVLVQRYNSLAIAASAAQRHPHINCLIQQQEIMMSRTAKTLTYQFHPESVGTSFRKAFMQPLLSIIPA